MADQEFRIKKGLRVQDALVINDQGNIAHADRLPEIPIAKVTGLQTALTAAANSTQDGVMLSTDKTKLDGIAANAQPGTVTSVATGNGLSGGPITTTGTISVVANNGLSANATGIYVVGGNGLVSNTTGVHVGAANGISVTADAVGLTTGSTLTVNTSGVHVNTSLSITDLTLSGNLVVNGTLTTIDTDNLSVEDSLIQIARNNTSTDSLDIGVYGSFGATGAKYTGVFRDATDGKWKFFTGLTVAPNSTVDTANASFAIATIVANLESANVQITGGSITGITDLSVAGEITATGDITAFFSDERLKDRYDNISNPLDKVKTLNGFYYEPNEIAQSLGYEKKMYIGLSAQEVQAILPEVIKPAPVDNKYLTVDYAKLVPLLVEAIKEQQEHIERLESKIDLLGK